MTGKKKVKEVIFIHSGLGNQMFQYAFYKAKTMSGCNAVYDTMLCRIYKQHNGYELSRIFNINETYSIHNFISLCFVKKIPLLRKILNHTIRYIPDSIPSKFDPSLLLAQQTDTLFYGYWQCEDFFKNFKNEIIKSFSFNTSLLSNETLRFKAKIEASNSISIHIRRGDYLTEKNIKMYGGICNSQYYNRAVHKMIKEVENPTFFVFSNDMEWVKKNLDIPNSIYVNCNSGSDSWQDLYLMTCCKHNIIANSSFSWWGAWLNQSKNKIVISPSKFINIGDSRDLIPSSWIKI